MTNIEIIVNEALANNIYTEEEIEMYLNKYGSLPLYTFIEWKYKGYRIKKGEKALITTRLWKKVKESKEENEDVKKVESKFVLVKSSLFGIDQVEKIEEKEKATQ